MSYTKRFFELMQEVDMIHGTFTIDQKITIVSILLEEENKDRRTIEMNNAVKKPTEKQLAFLKKNNYANLETLSREQATEKIKEIIERRGKEEVYSTLEN
jgi:hypothetical protein